MSTSSSRVTAERQLRPYQERVLRDFSIFADEAWRRSAAHFGRIVLPPRTGKTAIAASIARATRLPATFLVPTKTLVEQTAKEVESWLGEPVGVLYADRKAPLPGGTNVTTYAQLERCSASTWSELARAPLVFVDEAHHTLTAERFRLLQSRFSPSALRVALTATPDYDEVRALCRFFPRLIHELPLEDALGLGLLAPLRVWVLEVDADASGVRVVAGDYEDVALGSVMGSQLFLDATLRLRYAPVNRGTRALVACRTRAQARHLARFFEQQQPAGSPRVGLILGDTTPDERRRLLADFEAGAVDTLVQVGVLIEGWDSAACKVLIDLSPSLSLVRSAQKYFRVMTAHADREARIYVLLPRGLIGLPMLPNDLFGASLREYDCGDLIGPARASAAPSVLLELPLLDRVRARPKLVHHARLERPLLPRGDRAAVLGVLSLWFRETASRTVAQLLRHRFAHPLFVGSGYALLRWLGYPPSLRGLEALVAWLDSAPRAARPAWEDDALHAICSLFRFPRATRDVDGCGLDRARLRDAWRQPFAGERGDADPDAARAAFRAATGRALEPASDPESIALQRELGRYVERLLWSLTPRERRLIAWHHGLLDQPMLSTARQAELENVSQARVSHIIQKAHRKLHARILAFLPSPGAEAPSRSAASLGSAAPEPEQGAPELSPSDSSRPDSAPAQRSPAEPATVSSSPKPTRLDARIDAALLATVIEGVARVRGETPATLNERPPIYPGYRAPRRRDVCLSWRALPRRLALSGLPQTVDRLLQRLADDAERERGERLSALTIDPSASRGASLLALATAGDTQLELFLDEHTAVDALGDERRTFTAQVALLDVVPGVTLYLLGHAPPGTFCSELEFDAVAIDWTGATPGRAALAVARALECIAEEGATHGLASELVTAS